VSVWHLAGYWQARSDRGPAGAGVTPDCFALSAVRGRENPTYYRAADGRFGAVGRSG